MGPTGPTGPTGANSTSPLASWSSADCAWARICSFTRPVAAAAGDTFHADYGPLGNIAFRFV